MVLKNLLKLKFKANFYKVEIHKINKKNIIIFNNPGYIISMADREKKLSTNLFIINLCEN